MIAVVFAAALAIASVESQEIAAAQEAPAQTAENAHRFLSLIGQQHPIMLYPARYRADFRLEYGNVEFATNAVCTTTVAAGLRAYTPAGRPWIFWNAPNFNQRRLEQELATRQISPPPYEIDWSKVASVTLNDTLIEGGAADVPQRGILIVMQSGFIQLAFQDAATARRVHYAMEFLKAHCDRTAETGF